MCSHCTRPGSRRPWRSWAPRSRRSRWPSSAQAAGTVYLALDADRAGQDAMLRAARAATERKLEPARRGHARGPRSRRAGRRGGAGRLPLHGSNRRARCRTSPLGGCVAAGRPRTGPAAGTRRWRRCARSWRSWQVSPQLGTNWCVTSLIGSTCLPTTCWPIPPHPLPARSRGRIRHRPARPLQLDAVARSERSFLTMCVSSELGHEYVSRLSDDHFSSGPLRRVRDHLERHWDDPLAALPDDDPSSGCGDQGRGHASR